MNAHQIDANGVIMNTIVVDSLNILPGLVDASIGGQIGDTIKNGKVIPKVIIPESVPKLNARLALIAAGEWEDVRAFVASQGAVALAYLEDAQTMRRDNPLVNTWATARNKPPGYLDELFIKAAQLNP